MAGIHLNDRDHHLTLYEPTEVPVSENAAKELAHLSCHNTEVCPHCTNGGRNVTIRNIRATYRRKFLIFWDQIVEYDGECTACKHHWHEIGKISNSDHIRLFSPEQKNYLRGRSEKIFRMTPLIKAFFAGIVILIMCSIRLTDALHHERIPDAVDKIAMIGAAVGIMCLIVGGLEITSNRR